MGLTIHDVMVSYSIARFRAHYVFDLSPQQADELLADPDFRLIAGRAHGTPPAAGRDLDGLEIAGVTLRLGGARA